jgi:hypothetical protein
MEIQNINNTQQNIGASISTICYHCGQPATTRDHVPPKGLFPVEARNNLITIPSCDLHNNAYSHTEQLILVWLSQHCRGSEAGKVFDKNSKWLNTRGKKAYEKIHRHIPEEDVHAVEYRVVNEFMGKVAMGLYWDIKKQSFLDLQKTLSFSRDLIPFSDRTLEENKAFQQEMNKVISMIDIKLGKEGIQGAVSCKDVFEYAYFLSDNPRSATFKFLFYQQLEFFVVLDGRIYSEGASEPGPST